MIKKKNLRHIAIAATLGTIGALSLTGLLLNKASLENAALTNQAAKDLASMIFKQGATRENSHEFLRSIGYNVNLKNDEGVYFRPVVDGFWFNEVQIVVAPKMEFKNGQEIGNILYDAYGGNPVGDVVASFTREDLKNKFYSN